MVYALNKPRGRGLDREGHARAPHGRRPRHRGGARLYPVGRLDADSTGLLLLTNDGDLANTLMHPSLEVPKTYRAKVRARARCRTARSRRCATASSSTTGTTAPARVRQLDPGVLEITIHEGRKHQVKRMCEAVGHPVIELERVRFGPLHLGELRPGAARRLSEQEVAELRSAGPSTPAAGRGRRSAAGRGPGGRR